jgi:hypothetical protein
VPFEDIGKELECDESKDALARAMDGVKVKTKADPEKEKREENSQFRLNRFPNSLRVH